MIGEPLLSAETGHEIVTALAAGTGEEMRGRHGASALDGADAYSNTFGDAGLCAGDRYLIDESVALLLSRVHTSDGVKVGTQSNKRATTPTTCGAAIDVPLLSA